MPRTKATHPNAQKLMITPKGLRKTIRLELSEKIPEPDQKAGNTSTIVLGDAGTSTAMQDFTGILRDNSSLVTLPLETWTNNSGVAASA